MSKESKTIIANNSGHYIQEDQPDLVIKEIKKC